MEQDLFTEYGILRPLALDEMIQLRRSLDAFEESTGLDLAPYLLDAPFLNLLHEKIDRVLERDDDEDSEDCWSVLWALVHAGDTIIGFFDFDDKPGSSGIVNLRWSLNPDWVSSAFAYESLKALVDLSFRRSECRTVRVSGGNRDSREMNENLLKIGFRQDRRDKEGLFRLSKAVEGRLL